MSRLLQTVAPIRGAARGGLAGWTLVAAVNNERVFRNSLLASPAIDERCQVVAKRGFSCSGKAYNAGLDEAQHDIVVFAHQDVYLPPAWLSDLHCALECLAVLDPAWGVLGVFGVTRSRQAEFRGYCYSTGLGTVLGQPFTVPIPAASLDEVVLVVRRSSGLRFDEQLPGFHLYGTDICLQVSARGLGSYIISAFCVHNSNGVRRLPIDFWLGYLYMRRKWWRVLPVLTCCTTITKGCIPVARRLIRELRQRVLPPALGVRSDEVKKVYEQFAQSSSHTSG